MSLALLTNIRLVREGLRVRNALAYYNVVLVAAVNSFVEQAPWHQLFVLEDARRHAS
jgi:hypothetical protein